MPGMLSAMFIPGIDWPTVPLPVPVTAGRGRCPLTVVPAQAASPAVCRAGCRGSRIRMGAPAAVSSYLSSDGHDMLHPVAAVLHGSPRPRGRDSIAGHDDRHLADRLLAFSSVLAVSVSRSAGIAR